MNLEEANTRWTDHLSLGFGTEVGSEVTRRGDEHIGYISPKAAWEYVNDRAVRDYLTGRPEGEDSDSSEEAACLVPPAMRVWIDVGLKRDGFYLKVTWDTPIKTKRKVEDEANKKADGVEAKADDEANKVMDNARAKLNK